MRRAVLALPLFLLLACSDGESEPARGDARAVVDTDAMAPRPGGASAADAAADGAEGTTDAAGETADAAGDAARPDAELEPLDPTAPSATTGVYVAPGPRFEAELGALLAFQRRPSGSCPGLLEAGSCGNGVCDAPEGKLSCPADCVFHLVGAYNDLPICPDFQELVTVHSEAEVQESVRRALRAGQRVRAVGARHSASASICGDGLAIDMSQLTDLSAARIEGDVVYVQPGVRLIELGDFLAQRGLGIGFAHLGFRGVSVAGALGTAAHGSSPRHTNTVSHRVAALRMVLADGSLRTFREAETAPDLWRALTTHLGLLGVVVEVGLRVEKAFQLDTEISLLDEAKLLEGEGALALLEGCDWGQFNWFPHHRQAFRWCGKKTDAAGEQVDNTLLDPGVSPDLAGLAKAGFHAGTCDAAMNELLENARFDGLRDNPPLTLTLPDGTRKNTTHAVGPAHRMTSAALIDLRKDKYFQMDWEVAVPQQYIQEALRAARRVFDAHNVSLPGVGVFVRFGKIERGSWLSYHSAGKEFAEGQTAMFFETPVAVPAGYSEVELADYLHIYQELVSLFIRHFGARAHWGKNLDAIFELQSSLGTYAGRIEKMNQAVAELDPYGVFANAFARRIGIRWPRERDGFGALLPTGSDSCGTEAEPQCAYTTQVTYANRCRALRAGESMAGLVASPCAALVWDKCSALETETCVWDRKQREQSIFAAPLLRY
jgi:FAD/FMN-containing dehydrogenase